MPFRQISTDDVRRIRRASFMTRNLEIDATKNYVEAGGCFLGDYLVFYAPENVKWCWHPGLAWCGAKGDPAHQANDNFPAKNYPPGALLIAIRNARGQLIGDMVAYSEDMLLHNTYGSGILTFTINDSRSGRDMLDNKGFMPVTMWITNDRTMGYRKIKISQ